jgi:energy-coupling factor transporter ATP-binding protein EcfA2
VALDGVTRIDSRRDRPASQEQERELPELIWLSDSFEAGRREFLVRDLLEPGSLAVLYGEPGSGKSTLAVDLAFAIATGAAWRGRETMKGLALHVAGEGSRGLRYRQAAYCQRYDVPRTAPYAVLPQALALNQGGDQDLVALIGMASQDIGCTPRLVIIDTLSRCMVGDENSPVDMPAFIRAVDYVRNATGAAVLVLHHSGKDMSKGARGHTSLRAAADTELQVEGTANPRTLQVRKQRDLELAEPMGFRLEPVAIAGDESDQVTACVVVHEETAPVQKAKPAGKNQVAATTALREWCRDHPDADCIDTMTITGVLSGQGIGRQRRPEVLNYLVNARALTPSVGGFTIDKGML